MLSRATKMPCPASRVLGPLCWLLVAPWTQADETAAQNSRQAQDALIASTRISQAWLDRRDPVTGLLPRVVAMPAGHQAQPVDLTWTVKDSAADLYPFLVLNSHFTAAETERGVLYELLRRETLQTTRLDRLPDDVLPGGAGFVRKEIDLTRVSFGASEYMKDGLLPVTELLGDTPWSSRMMGIADDLIRHAPLPFDGRRLPADSCEVNGNMLQVLSRLYWKTGRPAYLEQLLTIADFYLLEMLPRTGFLPVDRWDLARRRPVANRFRMSDHGNEIVGGLAEAVVLVTHKRPDKAKEYTPAFLKMIDRLLAVGRNADGAWYHDLDTSTGKPITPRPVHCWGYMYNPVYTAFQLTGEQRYRGEVERAMAALVRKPSYLFDDNPPVTSWKANAYSDSVESALVLFNRLPNADLPASIDAAIQKIQQHVKPDGLVEGWYGDGNTIRTLLMYAMWKAEGTRVVPWSPHVRVGAVRKDGHLSIGITADQEWAGRIVFDYPRHRMNLGMPLNYPRLNEWPEWFVVEDDRRYSVAVGNGPAEARIGAELRRGVPLELKRGETVWLRIADGGSPPYGVR